MEPILPDPPRPRQAIPRITGLHGLPVPLRSFAGSFGCAERPSVFIRAICEIRG
jgi:hypothetical protein